MTSHPPYNSRHCLDTLRKSLGNFPQQIRASPDHQYIPPGTNIGNSHRQNEAGSGARAIYSFQRPVRRPDNGQGMLVNGRRLLFPFDSSITHLKYSLDLIPFPSTPISDGHDHDRADHGGHARSWSDRGDPMIEWSMKLGSPDRVIDHGHCSSIIEYGWLLSTILEYDRFYAHQGLNIHSIWILSIFTHVITRIEEPYPIVHLMYHGNLWLIQSV